MECEPYTYLSSFLLRYIQLSISGTYWEETESISGQLHATRLAFQ